MAKVPLFIPARIKKELVDMGFNEAMIKHMRPEEAWEIIEGRLSMVDYVISKSCELLNIDESDLDNGMSTEEMLNEMEQSLGVENPFTKLKNNISLN